jgi:hypothetical protein
MPTPDPTRQSAARPTPVSLTVLLQRLASATVTARALGDDGLTNVRFGTPNVHVELLDSLDEVHRVLVEAVAQVEAIKAES